MSAETQPGAMPGYRIVVGVDGSPSATAALRWAVRQAQLTGGTVDAVAAWQVPVSVTGYGWPAGTVVEPEAFKDAAEKSLAEVVSEVAGPGSSVRIEPKVIEGYAPRVLVDAASDADLLVVGSRGHGAFADVLLGSVSQHCSHHAACPVVILRGQPNERRSW